jgi:hypothetical protein
MAGPPPAPPDPFDEMFATGRSRAAERTEFRPAVGTLGEESARAAQAPHRPPRSRPHSVIIFAIVATLAALASGGVGAWWVTSHEGQPRSAAARAKSPSPSASSSAAARPTAGSDAVAIAPALAGQPDVLGVAALLKSYFASINSHDFAEYSSLFVPQIRGSAQHFNDGYRSTTDSGATLVGLAPTGTDGLAATVTFTSRQNPADSPNHAGCDQWDVVLPLVRNGTGYLIARSPAGYQPSVHTCS